MHSRLWIPAYGQRPDRNPFDVFTAQSGLRTNLCTNMLSNSPCHSRINIVFNVHPWDRHSNNSYFQMERMSTHAHTHTHAHVHTHTHTYCSYIVVCVCVCVSVCVCVCELQPRLARSLCKARVPSEAAELCLEPGQYWAQNKSSLEKQ